MHATDHVTIAIVLVTILIILGLNHTKHCRECSIILIVYHNIDTKACEKLQMTENSPTQSNKLREINGLMERKRD
jgi:hypothetical protein